ncbi:unnamed protein product [Hymenolepis diminuta]|uniref:Lob domain-containing protein n=1 Tax=Hymenolepis diminuta TaxID=6216 RepID=A0A0R3S8A4_HYMDI|nr:unnamed protein product [Hymenolepis diminuta]
MADLVDQHRFGSTTTMNSYWIASPSPSSTLDNHSLSGSNSRNLSSHVVYSDPSRLHIRIRKSQRPNGRPALALKLNTGLPNGVRIPILNLKQYLVRIDSVEIPGSASNKDPESGKFNLRNEDPSSSPSNAEEDEDNLPLSDLCRRVIHPSTGNGSTSPPLCAASNCLNPVSQSDKRLGGRYCSPECLIRACRQAFHSAFPKISLDQDEQLNDQIPLKSASPTTFTNPEGLVS